MGAGIENLFQLSAVSSGSIGIDLNEGHAARLAIIGCVAVQFSGFGQISRGNQNGTLRIAQQGNFVQVFQGIGVYRKEVTFCSTHLHTAACANIDLIAVHNGGGCCLRGNLVALQVG